MKSNNEILQGIIQERVANVISILNTAEHAEGEKNIWREAILAEVKKANQYGFTGKTQKFLELLAEPWKGQTVDDMPELMGKVYRHVVAWCQNRGLDTLEFAEAYNEAVRLRDEHAKASGTNPDILSLDFAGCEDAGHGVNLIRQAVNLVDEKIFLRAMAWRKKLIEVSKP